MQTATVKVQPWGEGQGEYVLVNAADFDPARHVLIDGEALPAGVDPPALLNLNAADAKALADAIPGVGLRVAKRIVAFRDEHGPFASVADLQAVSGIGAEIVAAAERVLTVEG